MKWSRNGLIVVLVILSISFIISSRSERKLSKKIKQKKLKSCIEQKLNTCELIELYHNECFSLSYRSEYKLKDFYPAEYDSCLHKKIEQHDSSK
jgi:hypothetical protein